MTRQYAPTPDGNFQSKDRPPAMTDDERRSWRAYRKAMDALPPGAALCSTTVSSMVERTSHHEDGE